jgi:hypothetical protein
MKGFYGVSFLAWGLFHSTSDQIYIRHSTNFMFRSVDTYHDTVCYAQSMDEIKSSLLRVNSAGCIPH